MEAGDHVPGTVAIGQLAETLSQKMIVGAKRTRRARQRKEGVAPGKFTLIQASHELGKNRGRRTHGPSKSGVALEIENKPSKAQNHSLQCFPSLDSRLNWTLLPSP